MVPYDRSAIPKADAIKARGRRKFNIKTCVYLTRVLVSDAYLSHSARTSGGVQMCVHVNLNELMCVCVS